jgi:hypothetical protein
MVPGPLIITMGKKKKKKGCKKNTLNYNVHVVFDGVGKRQSV